MWSAARSAKISMILCMPERVSGASARAQVQMTLRYAHVSDRDVEAAAERIGGVMAGIMNRSPVRPEATP